MVENTITQVLLQLKFSGRSNSLVHANPTCEQQRDHFTSDHHSLYLCAIDQKEDNNLNSIVVSGCLPHSNLISGSLLLCLLRC